MGVEYRGAARVERVDACLLLGEQRCRDAHVVPRLCDLGLDHSQPRIHLADVGGKLVVHRSRVGEQLVVEADPSFDETHRADRVVERFDGGGEVVGFVQAGRGRNGIGVVVIAGVIDHVTERVERPPRPADAGMQRIAERRKVGERNPLPLRRAVQADQLGQAVAHRKLAGERVAVRFQRGRLLQPLGHAYGPFDESDKRLLRLYVADADAAVEAGGQGERAEAGCSKRGGGLGQGQRRRLGDAAQRRRGHGAGNLHDARCQHHFAGRSAPRRGRLPRACKRHVGEHLRELKTAGAGCWWRRRWAPAGRRRGSDGGRCAAWTKS